MPRKFILSLVVWIGGLTVFALLCGGTYRYKMDQQAIIDAAKPSITKLARTQQAKLDHQKIKKAQSEAAIKKYATDDQLQEARAEQQLIDQGQKTKPQAASASSKLVKSYEIGKDEGDGLLDPGVGRYIKSVTLNNGNKIYYSADGHVLDGPNGSTKRSKWAVKTTALDDIKKSKHTNDSRLVGQTMLIYKHASATTADNSTKKMELVTYTAD